jgi:dihydrolipoamide dehydrogenase
MRIKYSDAAGNPGEYLCDIVLIATGKRPNTAKLNLEAAGVELDGAAIKTDAQCRTSAPHIFAVGDVIGGYMLAHTAAAQGRVAAHNLLGKSLEYRPELDCGVTFSRPQAGFVGLSLAQAKARGIDVVEARMPLSIDAKAMITLETQGMIKLVADKTSGRIIGAHFLADHTDTLIGAAVMMVSGGLTLTQVAQAIFPHPTQTEIFGELARRLLARLRRLGKS